MHSQCVRTIEGYIYASIDAYVSECNVQHASINMFEQNKQHLLTMQNDENDREIQIMHIISLCNLQTLQDETICIHRQFQEVSSSSSSSLHLINLFLWG